jgi:hypothetical protein
MPAVKQQTNSTIFAETEADRLRRDMFRPDMEKFKLFTQMLRNNAIYKRAKITHK